MKPWQSKRNIINLISAIAVIAYPPAAEFLVNQPVLVVSIFTVINVALSFFSKGKVVLGE